jgi:hypothetical protein
MQSAIDDGLLKQKFKFQSEALAKAQAENRRLLKQLKAQEKQAAVDNADIGLLALAFATLEIQFKEPSWDDSTKLEQMGLTICQTRQQIIKY